VGTRASSKDTLYIRFPSAVEGNFLSDHTGILNGALSGWTVSTPCTTEPEYPLGYGPAYTVRLAKLPSTRRTTTRAGSTARILGRGLRKSDAGADLSNHFSKGKFDPANPTAAGAYFSPTALTNPSYGSLGNAGPYVPSLTGFGTAEEDLALSKSFSFGESIHMELRGEFFNVFNRHYFADPDTT